MKAGFSFCDTDISKLGLEYAPELEKTYVYKPSTVNIHEETFDGHHGGYFYGATYQPKEFNLKCIFQDSQIDRGIFSQIYALFRKGRSGRLVFTRRPWCYYYATVTDVDDSGLSNYLNGYITVTMKAYYPFARCDTFVNARTQKYHEDVMLNSALFDQELMADDEQRDDDVKRVIYDLSGVKSKTIYLPNPGTEKARLSISIAGNVGQGVTVTNKTNGQSCGFVAVSNEVTYIRSRTDMSQNAYVYVDGISGKTILVTGNTKAIAFMYHDQGFIELEPAFPAIRNVYITYNRNAIAVSGKFTYDVVGKFIFAGGKWNKILSQDRKSLTVSGLTGTGSMRTTIMDMNEIEIKSNANENLNIDMIKFDYKPTFA